MFLAMQGVFFIIFTYVKKIFTSSFHSMEVEKFGLICSKMYGEGQSLSTRITNYVILRLENMIN